MSGAVETLARRRQALALRPAGILSNGGYTALLTARGTGFSAVGEAPAGGHLLTRWSGDAVEDGEGWFFYVRDAGRGLLWSAGTRPAPRVPERRGNRWAPGTFALERLDDGVETVLEACVASGAPLEFRRLTLHNRSGSERRLEVTSCAEIVLHRRAADAGHPAFSKLFVQTEAVPGRAALLARRRPRGHDERHPWLACGLAGDGAFELETDRARFLGRGRSLARPLALEPGARLSCTVGNVLDPVACLRRACTLGPGKSASFVFALGTAPGRDEARALLADALAPGADVRAFAEAGARERALLHRLGVTEAQAELYQALASAVVYGQPELRAAPEVLSRAGATDGLARYGVQRQRPFLLCRAARPPSAGCLAALARALRYWRELGLPVDLLVLCEDPDALSAPAVAAEGCRLWRASEVPPADRDRLAAAAALVLEDGWEGEGAGTPPAIADEALPEPADSEPPAAANVGSEPAPDGEPLVFDNGLGGFAEGGREYAIRLRPQAGGGGLALPPAPWVNVVAGESFGTLVSETGAGCTWSGNSREHRLTPWYNDPLRDPHGEALYVHDLESGELWSALPGPAPAGGAYEMRHGFGYSRCLHARGGLEHETTVFVPRREPVKVVHVRLRNGSGRPRRLALAAYQRLVLGVLPEESARFAVTRWDAAAGLLTASNPSAGEFAGAVAFAAITGIETPSVSATADRAAFLGGRGDAARPQALVDGGALDGRAGAGLDPCFALRAEVTLAAGRTLELAFLLGETAGEGESRDLVERLRREGALAAALGEVRGFWERLLSGVRVSTPARALDPLVNGWLAYQDLACRVWARTALYQSGGAFGFRDQLQDASALVALDPSLTRAQLLLHAAHQFVEGDVLHWWHPPRSRGIRTRFADDLLWLPYLTAQYVAWTGDAAVLEERVRFLRARALAEGEDEAYLAPEDSGQWADLYEHCCRALDRSLVTGQHGLPLFGCGDWNDGMNRVGRQGRGESVWMGFFLYAVLGDFLPLCERRADGVRLARYRAFRTGLAEALEREAWDGAWYRRGYYDDGAPLGSAGSDECRIDALAQAWAVLSGAAPPERARRAMDAVEQHLVSEADGLVRLLTPAFENTPHDPGYIKGYVPGVRENGGQYTHAAMWVVRALAELGRRDRAARLLERLSPVAHARTPEETARYKVEPYVVAADVYGEPPHVGRGGWTWYTGSAGWMLRVALESVLGLRMVEGRRLEIRPCVPDEWPSYTISYRLPGEETRYEIVVSNPEGRAERVREASVDGRRAEVKAGTACVPLEHDGRTHRVEVRLGERER